MISKLFPRTGADSWQRRATGVDALAPEALRAAKTEAEAARAGIDGFLLAADIHLAALSQALEKPRNADWAWRPAIVNAPLPPGRARRGGGKDGAEPGDHALS